VVKPEEEGREGDGNLAKKKLMKIKRVSTKFVARSWWGRISGPKSG